jgi:CheY-like chemotaxis protein
MPTRTVLLVDDFASIREILRNIFERAGFSVCAEAENGAEAIVLAEMHKPDLIILDHSMPVMGGLETAPTLRRILPNTAIILFTLYADSVLPGDAAASGICTVVAKGDLDTLMTAAQSHLEPPESRKGAAGGS